MNTKRFKFSLIILFLWMGVHVMAQTQTLCVQELETYTVDDGDSSGNNYTWSLEDSGANDLSTLIQNNGQNSIDIDWSNVSFTVGETYTLSVVETINGCPGPERVLTIELINGYQAPTVTTLAPVCNGDTANFELLGGTLGATISYQIESNINGVVVAPTTIVLDGTDTNTNPTLIEVPSLADPTVAEEFTLILTTIDDDGSDACPALDIDPDITQTVTVNPAPETTEIQFN